ncbi:MAG: ABC transporter ATP-binding protein [Candidatus Thermoplasmatota archaeon]|nr:ABC transporter ATP-binding protein [Candidatus Thermoplasmatota archaeon]
MAAVAVHDLRKHYGEVQAVRGVTFDVQENEIYGLIGPNGAGKTTVLRVISTLLQITGGSVDVFGHDVADEAQTVRRMISYLPEDAGAYKNLTGRDYLRFMASFFDGSHDMTQRAVDIADLGERIDDKVEQYSKGMTRRLLVARALMVQPRLAILDEPTSGLDVVNAREIRNIIRATTEQGTTILLSSHNMLEVEYLCDRIALINDGVIVEQGSPAELREKYGAATIEDVFTEVVA